jgi:hypothetical protein
MGNNNTNLNVKKPKQIVGKTNNAYKPERSIAFWRTTDPNGYLCQWYASDFEFTEDVYANLPDRIKNLKLCKDRYDVLEKLITHGVFSSAEKFMMMAKAALFKDERSFKLISESNVPRVQKEFGTLVENFDETVWNNFCRDIVKIGNYCKFNQNAILKQNIKNTGNAILIEGSPYDRIWGVGIQFDSPNIRRIAKWKGENYLGECLMFVRSSF